MLVERASKVRERSVSDLISRLVLADEVISCPAMASSSVVASLGQKSGWEKSCLVPGGRRDLALNERDVRQRDGNVKGDMRKIYD